MSNHLTIDQDDLQTNIKIGRQIFEQLPNDYRPGWAGLILSRFTPYLKDIPAPILQLYPIIDNQDRWKEAHQLFQKIRSFGLDNKDYQPEAYLRLAEKVAKVTYNASGMPAPFDSDSGHYISSIALKATEHVQDDRLVKEVKSAIRLYSSIKRLKGNPNISNDFLLYQKIENLLWLEWHSIATRNISPGDGHQSFVPEIFGLVKTKFRRHEIADRLYKLEIERLGINRPVEDCLILADKILCE